MQTFLCHTLHPLPAKDIMSNANIPLYRQSNYAFRMLGQKGRGKRAIKSLQKGDTCIARPSGPALEILPFAQPVSTTTLVPYGLAYDFWLESSTLVYETIASFYGFAIITIPEIDYQRAMAAMALQEYDTALLYIDRAYYTLAKKDPSRITDEVDRKYDLYAKLFNLYAAQPTEPEGMLAAERAYQTACKCYNMLSKGNN